jgi:branched-chain amino acid transport system substrate-binding protein
MKRRALICAMAASAAAIAVGLGAPGLRPAAAADEIVLGAVVPITGPLSLSGRQYYDSLQMAQDDINAKGGIAGKKLRIAFEDTQASNSTAVNAFVKLVQDQKPALIFLSSYSTQNLATSPEVSKAEIPVFYAGGADAVAAQKNPWMFRVRPNDGAAAFGMASFVKDGLKKSKPGILYIQNDFGQGAANVAVAAFKEQGINVVGTEAYGETDKDMSAQFLKLKDKGADSLLAFVYPTDGALLMKQQKQLGFKVPFVVSSGGFLPAALNLLSPEEMQDVWGVVDAFLDPGKSPAVKDFVERYKKRFNRDADPYAASYYDAAMIAAEAIAKAGTDPRKLREYIAAVKDYKGVGHVYSFDGIGNGVHDVAVVKAKPNTKDLEFVQEVTLLPKP